MLNPLHMNFYGTRNEGSYEFLEVSPEPTELAAAISQTEKSDSLEPKEILNQDDGNDQTPKEDGDDETSKEDGVGKWMHSDRRKKCSSDPYPNLAILRKHFTDKNLPKQLREQFTAFKCNLCNSTMGSTATAKDHYEGKKHKTNVKKWIAKNPGFCDETTNEVKAPPKLMDLGKLYCKYCDVMLSSEHQADSHYRGKKHQNVLASGIPKNAYFNPVKKQWERYARGSTDGRFGIGMAFVEKDIIGSTAPTVQKLFCKICHVPCPTEATFNSHIAGAKHKRKMALLNRSESSSAPKDDLLEEVIKTEITFTPTSDLSIYRTPSGKYYCDGCNVTVNSPVQFLQHSESKKHKSKVILSMAKH